MDDLVARIAFNAPLVPTIRRIRRLKGPEDLDDSVRNFAVAEKMINWPTSKATAAPTTSVSAR